MAALIFVAVLQHRHAVLYALPFADQPRAGDRAIVYPGPADHDIAVIELLAENLEALQRRRLETAEGEFLDPVGEPAFKEAAIVGRRLGAAELAPPRLAVVDQVRHLLRQPEIIVRTWQAARDQIPKLGEGEVREALIAFHELWDELFPAEQARIVQLLVERVEINLGGIDIRLRTDGLASLVTDLRAGQGASRQAA